MRRSGLKYLGNSAQLDEEFRRMIAGLQSGSDTHELHRPIPGEHGGVMKTLQSRISRVELGHNGNRLVAGVKLSLKYLVAIVQICYLLPQIVYLRFFILYQDFKAGNLKSRIRELSLDCPDCKKVLKKV